MRMEGTRTDDKKTAQKQSLYSRLLLSSESLAAWGGGPIPSTLIRPLLALFSLFAQFSLSASPPLPSISSSSSV